MQRGARALTLGVDPQDQDRVYRGIIKVFRSTTGGGSESVVSQDKIHDDPHALVFSPPTHWAPAPAPTRIWVGTDGGIASSTDGGETWSNLNGGCPDEQQLCEHPEGIATNLFFSIDIGRGSAFKNAFTYGGTQDTGTPVHRPEFPGTNWHLGSGASNDGAGVAVDPTNPLMAYGVTNGRFIRTQDGGDNWTQPQTPPPDGRLFAFRHVIDPNSPNIVFTITPPTITPKELWRSIDSGLNFGLIATFPAFAKTIANTRTDSNLLWVGLTDGTLQRTSTALAATPPGLRSRCPGRSI